jgi:aminomethyltransferase
VAEGREVRGSDVRDVSDDYALLAVQGPRALERLGLPKAKAFTWAMGELDGVEVMVNRTGYTARKASSSAAWPTTRRSCGTRCSLAASHRAGLGARDTLRLEVCYPLHGNDIGPQWDAISRPGLGVRARHRLHRRRRLRDVKERGPERKLVAFRMTEKAIPRQGMAIEGGGEVTSGSHSPMLDVGIGMGYVPAREASRAPS